MKTIIIATDFSPSSLNAANYALDLALFLKAELLLFHTFQLPIINNEVPIVMNYDDFMATAVKEIEALKSTLQLRSQNQCNVNTMVKMGSFFDELKLACEATKPYAVVLGSQGASALENLFYGSETVYAMRHLLWPVIAVPPQTVFSSIKEIGLASDFDHVIDSTPMAFIKSIMEDTKCTLHVLNIGQKEKYNPDTIFESGMLQELLADYQPVYHVFESTDVAEGLTDFANKNAIDLLLIVPKHHTFFEGLLNGSHTKKLVFKSHVPIMSLHA